MQAMVRQTEPCLRPLELASSLPPSVFHDPDWYETEQRALFHAGWVAVARSSELRDPNDFVTADIGGEPVVVVRKRDGELAAMSNVCPHRSTTIISEPAGSAPSLQCSYHLWTFNHEGELRVAPGMENVEEFDNADVCLPRFSVTEWHGFVLVNIDGKAEPLATSVPHLDALMAENRIAECVSVGRLEYPSPWNWKISVENFLESYHHRGVHPVTLDTAYPWAKSFGVCHGDEPWSGVDHVAADPANDPFIALCLYPSMLIAISRGMGMFWFRLTPLSADRCHLSIESLVLPEFAEEAGIGDVLAESIAAINAEDIVINERTATGLRSQFARAGRVSVLEKSPWHFRQWLVTRVAESIIESSPPVDE